MVMVRVSVLLLLAACDPVDDVPSVPRPVIAAPPGAPTVPAPEAAPPAPPAPDAAVSQADAHAPASQVPARLPAPKPEPPRPGEPSLRIDPVPARRVVVLSIDGLRSDAIVDQPYDLPGFSGLRRDGASTLAARTDPGRTVTLPNHTCMITGRPTDGPEGHGFSYNGVTDQTLHDVKGGYVASLFDVVHDHGYGTALVASKPKFDVYPNSYDATHGAPDPVPPDHGRAKLDAAFITSYDDDATLGNALQLLAGGRMKLIFIHLYECDSAGHGYGFDPTPGTPYAAAVLRQDARIQRLRAALDSGTMLIVTTDHGGTGLSHGDPSVEANYTIPFFVVGPGVRPGADLYALNPARRQHPGRERAATAEVPPIRNCEAGNLALSLLNLPPIPGSTIGRGGLALR